MGCDNLFLVKEIELGWEFATTVEGAVVAVPEVLAGDVAAGGGSTARPRLAARARNFEPAEDVRFVDREWVV